MSTRPIPVAMTLAIAAVAAALTVAPLLAQQTQYGRTGWNEFTITAEPIAGGARYLRGASAGLLFGAGLTVGPLHGVTLADSDPGSLDEWATLHAVVGFRSARGIQLSFGPGVALAIGDDFASLYPSAQVDFELAPGRFRLGTVVRVMRIAGGYGSGDYWVRWIPARLGIAFD